LAKNDAEAGADMGQVLRTLKKKAGYEQLDADYFRKSACVKADLLAFASQLDGVTVPELSNGAIGQLEIVCQNGVSVRGKAYLRQGAVALGYATEYYQAVRMGPEVLDFLIKLAGFSVLDENYFKNSAYLRQDLEAMAQALGENISVLDLSANRTLLYLKITCCNGQVISVETYLHSAAKAMGLAEDVKQASGMKGTVLKVLIREAGFRPLDEDYFSDPEAVDEDLKAFKAALGDHKTYNPTNLAALTIACSNSQVMKGGSYFVRAAKAFGLARTKVEAKSKRAQILLRLEEIAQSINKFND